MQDYVVKQKNISLNVNVKHLKKKTMKSHYCLFVIVENRKLSRAEDILPETSPK